ncbi:hypothetical protein [Mycobacterium bohemicum]|uniref:Uncharacterized protein n=2 Tax=Mycobacterium bohemicum TaxID=56425 RepID=A0A1X1QWQ4_MYCBE|nr:hypothetical protein [Mycobacterium bohemicum]MCV6970062.1 hypothetical protein [Mycobacterium bohemicum]ORU95807.1 hypothetical protein AWB93_22785 [Mycobacterium bohemicum]
MNGGKSPFGEYFVGEDNSLSFREYRTGKWTDVAPPGSSAGEIYHRGVNHNKELLGIEGASGSVRRQPRPKPAALCPLCHMEHRGECP